MVIVVTKVEKISVNGWIHQENRNLQSPAREGYVMRVNFQVQIDYDYFSL